MVDGVRSPALLGGPASGEEAVVFVHGNPGFSRYWEDLLRLLLPVILESQAAMSAANGATIELKIPINRRDDENSRCNVSRAWDPRKDFSQFMRQPTTRSTPSAISPQQEHTEPSGHRPCKRGERSSPRREPDVPADFLRAQFGNVTKPAEEYDPRAGRMLGNFPQAFSHVGLINTAINLASVGVVAFSGASASLAALVALQGAVR